MNLIFSKYEEHFPSFTSFQIKNKNQEPCTIPVSSYLAEGGNDEEGKNL